MSLEVKIHDAQTSILRELLFHPHAGYAELQKPTGLEGDHFNFHIVQLVKRGLVEKQARGRYSLTPTGKEYANKLDTDSNTIERQPKVSVILVIWRDATKTELLLQERLKTPTTASGVTRLEKCVGARRYQPLLNESYWKKPGLGPAFNIMAYTMSMLSRTIPMSCWRIRYFSLLAQ